MKIKITKSDVVNGSVYLAGSEPDVPDVEAKACLDAGIAVSIETPHETIKPVQEPVQKLKKEKGA